MLAYETLECPSQERIDVNRDRSVELFMQIFEILSEGTIRICWQSATEKEHISALVSCALKRADLLMKEREWV
jgi:hypothetical protein